MKLNKMLLKRACQSFQHQLIIALSSSGTAGMIQLPLQSSQSRLLPLTNQVVSHCGGSRLIGTGGPTLKSVTEAQAVSAKDGGGGGGGSSENEAISQSSSTSSSSESTAESIIFPVTGHRLFYGEYGEPENVIRKERITIDEIKPGQVLVKMLAAPVNPADINTIQGTYAIKPKQLPAVPGNEGVGIVVHSELDNTESRPLKVGDWVIPSGPGMGTWQAYLTGEPADFIKIPSTISIASAATLSVNPCTAYRMLRDFEKLNPGDCVIQNGGNSAVGQAVIQLCRELGLKSVSLIRPRDDFKAVKAKLLNLGNSDTIVITDEDLRASMRGMKAQLGLNCVGGKSATDILRVLESSRTMVTYGGMSRQPVIVPTSHLIFNDIRIKGFWMTRWNAENTLQSRTKMLENIAELMKINKFSPPEHKFLPLAKYREALEKTMKGFTGLKYIISFDSGNN